MSSVEFYAKILLFGEYSIIRNSMALAIPYELFSGHLTFGHGESTYLRPNESNNELKSLLQYLKHSEPLEFEFDLTSFEFDLSQGLYFQSTIPPGYGVGSSGALIASIYDRYGKSREKFNQKMSPTKILKLKKNLAFLESHFHGKSSGVDPLLSYISKPLLINSNDDIRPVLLPYFSTDSNRALFIINTNRARKTEALMSLFIEKLKSDEFLNACDTELKNVTNQCIQYFLENNFLSLYSSFKELSSWQFDQLNPMIPKLYQNKWNKGLKSDDYYLKLCGAGGGGFILGITKDLERLKKNLETSELRILFKF